MHHIAVLRRFNYVHLQKLEEKAPTAQQTQGDLQTLADNVRSFKAVIDETLGKAEDKCVSDIKEAKDHLNDLDKKLESSVSRCAHFEVLPLTIAVSGCSINDEVCATKIVVQALVIDCTFVEKKTWHPSSERIPAGRSLRYRRDVRAGAECWEGVNGKFSVQSLEGGWRIRDRIP